MTGKVRGGKQRKGTKFGLVKKSKWHERLSNFDVGPFSLENRRRGRNDNKLRRQRGQSVASVPRNCKQAKHTRSRESGRAGGAAVRETRGGAEKSLEREKRKEPEREREGRIANVREVIFPWRTGKQISVLFYSSGRTSPPRRRRQQSRPAPAPPSLEARQRQRKRPRRRRSQRGGRERRRRGGTRARARERDPEGLAPSRSAAEAPSLPAGLPPALPPPPPPPPEPEPEARQAPLASPASAGEVTRGQRRQQGQRQQRRRRRRRRQLSSEQGRLPPPSSLGPSPLLFSSRPALLPLLSSPLLEPPQRLRRGLVPVEDDLHDPAPHAPPRRGGDLDVHDVPQRRAEAGLAA